MVINNFESKVEYNTKLSSLNFDGPLDLLLYLIKQAEIDVKDIFVSEVTTQFLEYVNTHTIDMETESEYLSIAATIIEIKSKAIIPNEEAMIEAEEEGNSPQDQEKESQEVGNARMALLCIDGGDGCPLYRSLLLFLHPSVCLSLETLLRIQGLWRVYAFGVSCTRH